MSYLLLAGDVGATKTALAVFASETGPRKPLAEVTLPSAKYSSLETLVLDFLGSIRWRPDRASIGVAGPVVDGRADVTNLPWEIDEQEMEVALGIPTVRLLNDAMAVAHVVPVLGASDLLTLHRGEPDGGGAKAVIALGTGLGEAFLTWDGSRYCAFPSEGGWSGFAPEDALQIALLRYLEDAVGYVGVELVCSGMGIPNLYSFLKQNGGAEEPDWLAERLSEVDDPTPVIVNTALSEDKRCDLCVATLRLFVSILAAEAGNFALKVLATGGVYLGGGIPPRILPAIQQDLFLTVFRNRGPMSDLLARVPVHVILSPLSALLGAASYGFDDDW